MKIKLIDLLKLMLKRKAPKKIKFLEFKMTFIETAEWGDYEDDNHHKLSDFRLIDCLNDFVEIIEEDKKIEKIEICTSGIMGFDGVENITSTLKNKINELIDEINKLKEGK